MRDRIVVSVMATAVATFVTTACQEGPPFEKSASTESALDDSGDLDCSEGADPPPPPLSPEPVEPIDDYESGAGISVSNVPVKVCKPGCGSVRPQQSSFPGASFPNGTTVGQTCTITCTCSNAPNGDRCRAMPATAKGTVRESLTIKYCSATCGGTCTK